MKKPRIIFMGKNKGSVLKALDRARCLGAEVVAVVVPSQELKVGSELYDVAKWYQLPVCSDIDIYDHLAGTKKLDFSIDNIDLVVSFLFPRRIKKPLIGLSRIGCVNFHSAPLPEYRGWGVYNAAILNEERCWGVSAHFVDENFDTGDLIKVNYFDIDPKKETAYSLERQSQVYLLSLFDEVIKAVVNGENLPRKPQTPGTTYGKPETLKHETIDASDSSDVVDKKIRAFWYPPFAATTILNGKKCFVVNQEIMEEVSKTYIDRENSILL